MCKSAILTRIYIFLSPKQPLRVFSGRSIIKKKTKNTHTPSLYHDHYLKKEKLKLKNIVDTLKYSSTIVECFHHFHSKSQKSEKIVRYPLCNAYYGQIMRHKLQHNEAPQTQVL